MADNGESIRDDEEESTRVDEEESTKKPTAWSRRTIMFDLPYWKDLPVHHNLDLMHIKSNVVQILLATLMGTKGKTSDGLQSCLDQ
ncbi:hypothetical protein GIB67_031738, partial [Kingdonia uniflora]